MKKTSLLSKIVMSRAVAMTAVVTMIVQTAFPSLAIAANELGADHPFQLDINAPTVVYNGDGTFDVALSGTGEASPFTWSSLGYYVRVDWGDSAVALSDTPSSGVLDTFATLDYGTTLTGTWSGEHTFDEAGTFNVVVELFYNPNQPHTKPVKVPSASNLSNDERKARITVPLVLTVPTQPPTPSSDDVTVCEENGTYRATLSGTQTLSPFTWSSLGYYVRATWGDGTTSYSDTPGGDITDTFHTPDYGRTLTGMWNATHTFTNAGEYDVVVDLFYNPNQPHTKPVKVPSASNLSNDELKATQALHINTAGAEPCSPSQEPEPQPNPEPEPGTAKLTVTKVWVPANNTPSEVTGSFNGGVFVLNEESSWSAEFIRTPGIYNLSENPVEGYESSIDCGENIYFEAGELTLTDGDDVTCTITNTKILGEGTITIEKWWEFADVNATPTYPNFQILLDGSDVGITSTTSVSPAIAVAEGVHTITEEVSGFDMALSCEATNNQTTSSVAFTEEGFTVNDGDEVYCIVTNTEQTSNDGDENGGGGNTEPSDDTENEDGENGGGGNTNTIVPNSNPSGRVDSGSTPTTGIGDTLFTFAEPRVEGIQDTDETLLTCKDQYPEAALITGDLDHLLAAYGFTRNTGLESTYAATLVPKILVPGAPLGSEQILQNFIVYGIQSLLELGAGERAGIVASFVNLYGHMPENECDWQNVIRIGQGVVPVIIAPEREAAVEQVFEEVYGRAANRNTPQDNVTVLIMAYGLRPDMRSLQAEIQGANIFKGIFGHVPQNTGEWDVMRGIAYGGLTVPGYSPIVR